MSSSSPYICSGDSNHVGVYVQDDGPHTNQVVQVGAAQLDHSVGIKHMAHIQCGNIYRGRESGYFYRDGIWNCEGGLLNQAAS